MNAYCDRQSVDFNAIAFLFDGRRLRVEQTPDEVSPDSPPPLTPTQCIHKFTDTQWSVLQLEMEDGDEIDAMLHQTGGATA